MKKLNFNYSPTERDKEEAKRLLSNHRKAEKHVDEYKPKSGLVKLYLAARTVFGVFAYPTLVVFKALLGNTTDSELHNSYNKGYTDGKNFRPYDHKQDSNLKTRCGYQTGRHDGENDF